MKWIYSAAYQLRQIFLLLFCLPASGCVGVGSKSWV